MLDTYYLGPMDAREVEWKNGKETYPKQEIVQM